MTYELWEARSGNRLGLFSSERDALEVVREIVAVDGMESVEHLFLDSYDRSGRHRPVVEGWALGERAGLRRSQTA